MVKVVFDNYIRELVNVVANMSSSRMSEIQPIMKPQHLVPSMVPPKMKFFNDDLAVKVFDDAIYELVNICSRICNSWLGQGLEKFKNERDRADHQDATYQQPYPSNSLLHSP